MKSAVRQYLDLVSQPPVTPPGSIIPPNWSTSTFLFGFKYLYSHYAGFPLKDARYHRNGAALLNVIDSLIEASIHNQVTISSLAHCHNVQEKNLVAQKLDELVSKFQGKTFFQFGKDGYRERIIGFFSTPYGHEFEVCLLDLEHAVFPVKGKRVFQK